ncbi:MAG: hypothetical protein RIR00_340 [Pseudomonadota bacterium]|jgi:SH3-like domain-containing protein
MRPLLPALLLGGMALSIAHTAQALEYRSVGVPVAILYDGPSLKARKQYLIRQATPVEVVVQDPNWVKVRDAEGTLAWIEKKSLSDRRTVIVTAPRAEVRATAEANAALVFAADKGVALEFQETVANGAWVRVRHDDGASGFVKSAQVWGK